ISQGGYYQYYFGENEAYRDPLQHMLPMIWSDPALARDVIKYSAEEQPNGLGMVPYGRLSLCRRFDLGASDDLDMWLLRSAAELADAVGDPAFAAPLRTAGTRDLGVVKQQAVAGGWFARGYSGARQIGVGSIWSEPQAWALLAGAAPPAQGSKLVAAYRRFLVGIGAPSGPSKIGAAIAPGSSDPGATEQSEPPVNNSTAWPGGSWYAV